MIFFIISQPFKQKFGVLIPLDHDYSWLGIESPTYYDSSPGGSIPHQKVLQSTGINPPQSSGIQRVHMKIYVWGKQEHFGFNMPFTQFEPMPVWYWILLFKVDVSFSTSGCRLGGRLATILVDHHFRHSFFQFSIQQNDLKNILELQPT